MDRIKHKLINNKGFALVTTMVILVIFSLVSVALVTSDLSQYQRRVSTNLNCEQRMLLDRAAQTAIKVYKSNTNVDNFSLNIAGVDYVFSVSVEFGESKNTVTIKPLNADMNEQLQVDFTVANDTATIIGWVYSPI